MKYAVEVRRSPTGELVPNAGVRVRKHSDGTTITSLTADENGLVTFQADGDLEPWYMQTTQTTGSPRFWSSRDFMSAGAISPAEIPIVLTIVGNAVIRGLTGELAAVLDGTTVTMSDGGVMVWGYPVLNYTQDIFSFSRPAASTRIDRIIARKYPLGSGTLEGKSEFTVLQGSEGGSAPALTNTSTVQEAALWKVTVPTAGALTLTDERTFAGETPPVTAITRSNAVTTTNASGEVLASLNTSLILPRTGTYDVEAWVSAIQDNGGGWVLQATYGSFGAGTAPNFNTPAQVAVDSSGNIFIADTLNHRLIKLNSSGAYVASTGAITIGGSTATPYGVCVDSAGKVYAAGDLGTGAFVKKWNNDLTAVAGVETSVGSRLFRHGTTDGTHLFTCELTTSRVYKFLCTNLNFVTSMGSAGTGDGQFDTPWGIDYANAELYVGDQVNSRVQVLNTTGTFQRKWSLPTDQCLGIAHDSTGRILVADFGASYVYRYTNVGVLVDTFAQATPEGIGVATGDVLWVSNRGSHTIAKWDENAAGYGGLAIEIDGNLGTYIALGDLDAMLQNSHTRTATGPATIVVKVYGKATSGTATFRSVVLSANAKPRS